jgi:exodeoxyribonuclease VIII
VSEQAIRFHHLKDTGRAPALGLFAMRGGNEEAPDDDDEESSDALATGTTIHAIVFGTQKVVAAPMPRNEKHKAYQEFMAANPGAIIETASGYEKAHRVADAIRSHPDVAPLLDGAVFEDTLYFELMGEKCRATPDGRHDVRRFTLDLKSTKSAAPWEFLRDAERRHYHAQLAMQRMAVREALGWDPECFLIAAEKTPPYLATVIQLSDRTLARGEELIHGWMETLLECRRSGVWPQYTTGIVEWDMSDDITTLARASAA